MYLGILRGHDHVVESVAFAPKNANRNIDSMLSNPLSTGEYLASASRDKSIKLWNLKTFECSYTFVRLLFNLLI